MTPLLRHILLPALVPLLFLLLAATPVEVLGCRLKGLLALAIVFPAILGSIGAALRAVARRRDPLSAWRVGTALLLAIPAVLLLLLA